MEKENIEETQKNNVKHISKKDEVKNENFTVKKTTFIGFVLLFIIIGTLIFFTFNNGNLINFNKKQSDVAAIVNGEVITLTDLNKVYESMPQQYEGTITKELLLTQLVESKVIYQEAKKQNLLATEDEVQLKYGIFKLSSGLTDEQFSKALETQGITEDELKEQLSKELTIQNFIDKNLLDKIEVSDSEIEKYYGDNEDEYRIPEEVKVRHILIGDQNLTEDEQNELAKKILPTLNENNFCDVVTKYSSDDASVGKCGEYTFSKDDPLVEGFKDLSFKQNVGDMGIVQTEFGSHIIWTVEKTPEKLQSLQEVKENVISKIKIEKGKKLYPDFYINLSKDSKIEIKYKEE